MSSCRVGEIEWARCARRRKPREHRPLRSFSRATLRSTLPVVGGLLHDVDDARRGGFGRPLLRKEECRHAPRLRAGVSTTRALIEPYDRVILAGIRRILSLLPSSSRRYHCRDGMTIGYFPGLHCSSLRRFFLPLPRRADRRRAARIRRRARNGVGWAWTGSARLDSGARAGFLVASKAWPYARDRPCLPFAGRRLVTLLPANSLPGRSAQ